MSVYARKLSRGTKWWFTGSYLGERYHSKAIYHTKQEAKTAERDRIREIDEKQRNPNLIMQFLKPLLLERLDEIQAKRSFKYYDSCRRYFKKLSEAIGEVPINTVTKKQINDLYVKEAKRLLEKGKTNHKLREMQRSLNAFFNWAINIYDLDIKNPCRGLGLYPVELKLKYIPTDEEIAKVYATLNFKQKILFSFVKETGARVSEGVRFFNNPEINGDQIILWTRKSKNSTLSHRYIPKPDCLNQDFSELRGEWTAYPRFLGEATKEKWNFHNLRHRAASLWAHQGMPTYEIMKRLGHSNISTTMIYLQSLGFHRL